MPHYTCSGCSARVSTHGCGHLGSLHLTAASALSEAGTGVSREG